MAFRVIRILVLLVGATGLGAWTCGSPTEEIFLLHNPDAETQPLVDQCMQAKQCMPLCEHLVNQSYANNIVHCEIHTQTDPEFIQVHVGLETFCGGCE